MQGLVELATQHLHDLGDAGPLLDSAELENPGLGELHIVLGADHAPIDRVEIPREVDLPVRGEADWLHKLLQHRSEDRNRVGLALDSDRRQGFVHDLTGGVPAGILVAQNAQRRCIGHEPRRQVHAISQDRVLHALGGTADATVASSSGHTETAHELEPLEDLDELHAGQHCSCGVVGVHERREPENEQKEHAFVVDQELVQSALVRIASPLDRGHQFLRLPGTPLRHDVKP
mmetsp:Transcript_111893/g.361368  ORF Transcript_111893/g.361368 Transcript_111893/m.361368 type:complete len:232 (-) Transcript_111893:1113-1808(-)